MRARERVCHRRGPPARTRLVACRARGTAAWRAPRVCCSKITDHISLLLLVSLVYSIEWSSIHLNGVVNSECSLARKKAKQRAFTRTCNENITYPPHLRPSACSACFRRSRPYRLSSYRATEQCTYKAEQIRNITDNPHPHCQFSPSPNGMVFASHYIQYVTVRATK